MVNLKLLFILLISNLTLANDQRISCDNHLGVKETSVFSSLKKSIKNINEYDNCRELTIGETRSLTRSSKLSIKPYASLTRVSERKLKANIVLNFKGSTPKEKELMRTKVNTCVDSTKGYMISPEGEHLELNILTPEQNTKLEPSQQTVVRDIKLLPAGSLANAFSYPLNIRCKTIIHELLHLLGLVDEHDNNDKSTFPCRSFVEQSVMGDYNEIFPHVVKEEVYCKCQNELCKKTLRNPKHRELLTTLPWHLRSEYHKRYCSYKQLIGRELKSSVPSLEPFVDVTLTNNRLSFIHNSLFLTGDGKAQIYHYQNKHSCECSKEDKDCLKFIQQKYNNLNKKIYTINNRCPYKSLAFDRKLDRRFLSASTQKKKSEYDSSINKLIIRTNPSLTSLLTPVQFDKIKWGSCEKKTQKYDECAKYAYKKNRLACSEKPKYCDSPLSWLY